VAPSSYFFPSLLSSPNARPPEELTRLRCPSVVNCFKNLWKQDYLGPIGLLPSFRARFNSESRVSGVVLLNLRHTRAENSRHAGP
jgi:hypothetical protein